MKRAIIKALNEIESQLSGQSAVATYSYPSVNDDRKEELTQDVGWPTLCQGSDRAAGAGRPRFRGRYRAERRPHDACREVLRQGMTQGADKK